MLRHIIVSALVAVSAPVAVCADAYSEDRTPSDANITGHVVDAQSGEHLPYYGIFLTGTSLGTLTDASPSREVYRRSPVDRLYQPKP